jgi:hypothetical protein
MYAILMLLCGGRFPGVHSHGAMIDRPRYPSSPRATTSVGSGSSSAIAVMRRKAPDGYDHRLMITIRDTAGERLSHASVLVIPWRTTDTLPATYDPDRHIYYADPDGEFFATIRVGHPGYEPQQRRVVMMSASNVVTFILGKPGDAYACIGSIMLPYEPRPDIIGFYLPRQPDSNAIGDNELKARLAATIPIERDSIEFFSSGGGAAYGVLHLHSREGAGSIGQMRSRLLRDLRGNAMIAQAGPVYEIERHSITGEIMLGFLSNRLYVGFMPGVGDDEIRATLDRMGLRIMKSFDLFSGVTKTLEVAADPSIGDDINDIARQLRALNSVCRADVVPFDIVPKDW